MPASRSTLSIAAVAAISLLPRSTQSQGAAHGVAHVTAPVAGAAAVPELRCPGAARLNTARGPVVGLVPVAPLSSFVDPTAHIDAADRITVHCRSYVGPFAWLDASQGPIEIGERSNVQDNVVIGGRSVTIGDRVIVAHGAAVMGPAVIGKRGGRPSFVGFNAYVDRATVEEDAMVGVLARVAPGVVIRSGRKVLPGKLVRTQAEADSLALGKVDVVTDADRQFMEGVLHVNVAFARQYIELYRTVPTEVRGIARDPGNSDFNHGAELPVLGGRASAHPDFAARIIGWVTMDNTVDELTGLLGSQVSIRADEGERFRFGRLAAVRDKVTFHALEHTRLSVGNGVRIGAHVVVHGGDDAGNAPRDETVVGDSVGVGDWAVVFRSTIGNGSVIGERAIIDGSQLPPGTIVPDRAIIIKNKRVGTVEW